MPRSTNDAELTALRGQIADLEFELAITLGELRRLRTGAASFEQRAVDALRRCDEASARATLLDRDAFMSEADVLEADVRVLRALLGEFHDFLRQKAPADAPGIDP